MSKINLIFSKNISFKNINSGDQFWVKTFFLDSTFEPLYFLKSLILGQKSYFFGPTIFENPHPNHDINVQSLKQNQRKIIMI